MERLSACKSVRGVLAVALSVAAVVTLSAGPGFASARPAPASAGRGTAAAGPATAPRSAASALLYRYQFANTTGTVANSAPDGPVVPLTLSGTWSLAPHGVLFSGNTSGDESVAAGKAKSGYTINEPSTATVGFGARILYHRPATGKCFSDTPNVTQIGRFSTKPFPTQAKIQLSSCSTSKTQVTMECRFAGSLTTASEDTPVDSNLPLVNDNEYNVSCVKSADSGSQATITLSVTRISTGQTSTQAFPVSALGEMQSHAYISAGNKYPLPSPADNTDQFNGVMIKAVYCAGAATDVTSCLNTYLPV